MDRIIAGCRRAARRLGLCCGLAVLGACGWQRYTAAPLDTEAAPRAVAAARLDDAALGAALHELGDPHRWPRARWTPRELGLVAALRSPERAAARAAIGTAVAARQLAGQRDNPTLGFNLEHHSIRQRGTHWSLGPNLQMSLRARSRRRLATALADTDVRDAALAALEAAWQARDGAWAAAEAVLAARQAARLLSVETQARDAALAAARAQVAAGLRDAFEWQTLELEANDARLARLEREHEQAIAEGTLAGALRMPGAALDELALERQVLPAAPDYAELQRQALAQHPRVLGALADYDRAEQELALAVAAQYPDIQLGPGYFFDQGDNMWSLLGGVVVPLFAAHDAAIERARRARDAAAERFRAVQAMTIADLQEAWVAWHAATAAARSARGVAVDIAASVTRLGAREAEGVIDSLVAARARLQQAEVALRVAHSEARARQARRALEAAARTPLADAAFARLLELTLAGEGP